MTPDSSSTSTRPPYLLWCSACGRLVGRTAAELHAHRQNGWPKCCDQVMAYIAAGERPDAVAPDPAAGPVE